MSDIGERIKERERASEVIVGKVLMWLGKEFVREVIFGFIYAFIFNFIMQDKLPFLARSRESDQEIIQELTREIGQNLRVQQQSIQEDTIRRIIEESYRMRAPRAVQPPAPTPYPQPAAPRTPYPTPTPVVQAYSEQLRSIDEEIAHYERLKRILEERWVKGEVQEEEYRKKLEEVEKNLKDLKLKKEQLLQAFTPR
jgi:hypothetical protein